MARLDSQNERLIAAAERMRLGDYVRFESDRRRRLWDAFTARCDQLGILYDMGHIISASRKGYGDRQLSFF